MRSTNLPNEGESIITSGATRPRLTFLGVGPLGGTYAACYAELGYEVLGYDVDAGRVEKFSAGELPFHERGLGDLVTKNLANGRLRFTTDIEEVAEFGDIHFLCVGTPSRPDSDSADLSYMESCVASLAPLLKRRCLVVGKSTVPVGTAAWVQQLIGRHGDPDVHVEVAWSPEFLQEANAVDDVLRPNRVVLAAQSQWAQDLLEAAHKGVFELAAVEDREVPLVVTDFATAELVKVAANAFLSTKISFINAMADLCDVAGGDVTDLARAIGYDARIGNKFLRAGIGFGGGCLPKDLRALAARGKELGVAESMRFLGEIEDINLSRRAKVVRLAAEMTGRDNGPAGPELSGTRITVLGATFKPDTDDVRDAPALDVAGRLAAHGAAVTVYDPMGMDNARVYRPELTYANGLADAVDGAELICVLVEWEEFRHLDPEALADLVAEPRVLDGMNCLDPQLWSNAGWMYRGMGRSSR
ncbi:MAG TPA: UDP-glucose/GDP-mannose dehydrogenase family protein [Stackebrandtia sp.]|jgi:UDPglucose 6-dehydrogenase|uniref:UDP-glucose dehydrogenase family protein n=1 Tax=Stackebrandtia sp. TaxID=2023065 RepID=UPI002D6D7017|nr:UDP-glucose/GDP-mannose dehydrogenase family protein [Stackebrandtia sp.]HZE39726.1 UDP-glucose/GDP-mannose dehydrogenase family protein [Stackebrandtia sp.]